MTSTNAKADLSKGDWKDSIRPILYRPFDIRYTFFDPHVAMHRRLRVMRHMPGTNLGLCTNRQVNCLVVQFLGDLLQRHVLREHAVDLHAPAVVPSVADLGEVALSGQHLWHEAEPNRSAHAPAGRGGRTGPHLGGGGTGGI